MVDRSQPARSARAAEAEPGRIAKLRRRFPWLDRLINAAQRYQANYGDYYAAGITFFSVLALVPLLMVVFAVAGFVLSGNPALLDQLQQAIAQAVPSKPLSQLINSIVATAVKQAGALGIIGLVVALYSGLGWMTNLREALTAQWGQPPSNPPFIKRMGSDLLALVGLGLALVASFAITAVGSLAGNWLLGLTGIQDTVFAAVVLWILTFLLAVGANWIVFGWVLARLPRQPTAWRSVVWGALFAAVGFEVLKQVGVVYLESLSDSPTAAVLGPILGLLVFAYLTSRFVLLVTAWTALSRENAELGPVEAPPPAVIRPVVEKRSAARTTAASAFGIGVMAGWLLRRRR